MAKNEMCVTPSSQISYKLHPAISMSVETQVSNATGGGRRLRCVFGLIFNLERFFIGWKTFNCSDSVCLRIMSTLLTFENTEKSSGCLIVCPVAQIKSSRPSISKHSRWSGGVREPHWSSCRATGMSSEWYKCVIVGMHSNIWRTPLWLMAVFRTSSTFRCFSTQSPSIPFLMSSFMVRLLTDPQLWRCNSRSRVQLPRIICMVSRQTITLLIFSTCNLLRSHPFSIWNAP